MVSYGSVTVNFIGACWNADLEKFGEPGGVTDYATACDHRLGVGWLADCWAVERADEDQKQRKHMVILMNV